MHKFLVAFVALGAMGLGMFSFLGGFDQPKITLDGPKEYFLVGYSYQGDYDSPKVDSLIGLMQAALHNGKVTGTFAVINYSDQESKEGQIKQFIGALTDRHSAMQEMELVHYEVPKVIRLEVTAHPLVWPRPDKVKQWVTEYAEKEGLKLSDFTIEQYDEDRLLVEIPVL